ncbi:uncharacterized protein EV420DRAFT_1333207, partial [Desarmillaria tabescens]
TATGSGKSASFAIPILVHQELSRNPTAYPRFRCRKLPVGIVVTPTNGLAANIVSGLKDFGINGLAYTHETLTETRKAGRSIAEEISSCAIWQVICVDPEHLRGLEWRRISASDTFRDNIIYACAGECHLILQWGRSFRPCFKHIGAFFRGRLPSTLAVIGLSATLPPGPSTVSFLRWQDQWAEVWLE